MQWLVVPILLQGAAIIFDEIYFHRKRGLPIWERIGHPLDTLIVIFCYLFLILKVPSELNMKIYIGLCVFSSLFITKDELVHAKECVGWEHWLHAVLFVLHPVAFYCAAVVWENKLSAMFLNIQLVLLIIMMFYQIIYWRFFADNKQRHI